MDSQEFESKVAEVLPKLGTEGFTGEGVDPAVLFAANAERRRRDTQAAYTRTQQELKQVKAVNQSMAETLESELVKVLPVDQVNELEELKHQDPDAWRVKVTELENERRSQVREQLTQIEQAAAGKTELEVRQEQLQAFTQANPDFVINDEVIANDIPPRITKKLEKGEISFTDFLEQCKDYLGRGKVVDKGAEPPAILDISKQAGSASKPTSVNTGDGYEAEVY